MTKVQRNCLLYMDEMLIMLIRWTLKCVRVLETCKFKKHGRSPRIKSIRAVIPISILRVDLKKWIYSEDKIFVKQKIRCILTPIFIHILRVVNCNFAAMIPLTLGSIFVCSVNLFGKMKWIHFKLRHLKKINIFGTNAKTSNYNWCVFFIICMNVQFKLIKLP